LTPAPLRSREAAAPARDATPSRTLVVVLIAAIVLGVVLRFDGLGRKAAWYDEVGTLLRLSGHTEAEVATLYDGQTLPRDELLQRFQSTRTGSLGDGVTEVLHVVAQDEPLHSPGYFVAASLWARVAGDGPAALRELSAVTSVASLVLLGALAWQLFRDRRVVLAMLALAALSPLQIRYAQEGRSYALWCLTLLATLLATHAASVRGTLAAWLGMTLALAAAFYVHPLTLLVLPALLLLAVDAAPDPHAWSGTGVDDCGAAGRPLRWPRAASTAVVAALVLWLPWMLVIIAHRHESARTAGWMNEAFPLASVARTWFGVATSVLFRPAGPGGLLDGVALPGLRLVWLVLGGLAVALIVAALAEIARRASRAARRFVPALALLPFLTLAAADLALGGRRSTVDRYLLPAWLAIELAVAFLLASPGPRARLRDAVLVVVLLLGATTALRSRPLDLWWNTEPERLIALRALDASLRAQPAAIVVTDAQPLRVLELARRLPSDATVRLGVNAARAIAPDEWSRVVLVSPSNEMLATARDAARRAGSTLSASDDGLGWRVDAKPR
jgi:uncharacterized membrane protein